MNETVIFLLIIYFHKAISQDTEFLSVTDLNTRDLSE